MTGKELREKTDEAALAVSTEERGFFEKSESWNGFMKGALHGPPIGFLEDALQMIIDTKGMGVTNSPVRIANNALATIREARR